MNRNIALESTNPQKIYSFVYTVSKQWLCTWGFTSPLRPAHMLWGVFDSAWCHRSLVVIFVHSFPWALMGRLWHRHKPRLKRDLFKVFKTSNISLFLCKQTQAQYRTKCLRKCAGYTSPHCLDYLYDTSYLCYLSSYNPILDMLSLLFFRAAVKDCSLWCRKTGTAGLHYLWPSGFD